MRRLGARIPAPEGQRWSDAVAQALVGKEGTLEVGMVPGGGELFGTVVEARVLGDEMGHAMWITVESDE